MRKFVLFGLNLSFSKKQSAKGKNIAIDGSNVEKTQFQRGFDAGKAEAYREAMIRLIDSK